MGSPSRASRRRRRQRYAVVGLALVVVAGVAGYAAWDVHDLVSSPAPVRRAAPDTVSSSDPRQQVKVTIVVTSDAPFGFTYVDHEGEEVEKVSEDGREISLDVIQRGDGPYLQVWAQSAPQASFVRCRIEVDGKERADEQVDGPAAATYCAA